MFDIGWPELLVIAIVLIVVVGPKDLPPMLRAFGRTTTKLKAMAAEFRGQFDEALREAELDDVKKTFDEARKLNPMQSIKDAINPLKAAGNEIKADLEKTVTSPAKPSEPVAPAVALPEPSMKLSDGPPEIKPAEKAAAVKSTPDAKPQTAATKPPAAAKAATKKAPSEKPSSKTVSAKPAAATVAKARPTAAGSAKTASRAPKSKTTKSGEGAA